MKKVILHASLMVLMLVPVHCFADCEPIKVSVENTGSTTQDYENAFDLTKDFFDLSIKKEKGMNYWAKQLMGLFRRKSTNEKKSLGTLLESFIRPTKLEVLSISEWLFKITRKN